MSRDRWSAVERGWCDYFACGSSSASSGSREAVQVAGLGRVVGAVGAAACGSAASVSLARPASLSGPGLPGGGLVRAVHRHALAGGAVSRAGVAERRELPASLGGLVAAIAVLQQRLAGSEKLDWSRVIVDASLVDAKKGARRSRARSWAGQAAAITWP